MPDTLPLRSALDGAASYRGSAGVLTMAEHGPAALLQLEGARPGPELTAFLANLAATALPAVGETRGADAALLGIGPSIWLLVVTEALPAQLGPIEGLGRAFEVVVDASHAYACIEIAGAKAGELLAKGCALDLHPRQFPSGACASTSIGGMRTIIRRAPDRFQVLVARSYAHSLWHWLLDAGQEYENSGQ